MNGRQNSSETLPETAHGAVNSASRKTPPPNPTKRKTSESASMTTFGTTAAYRSSEPAERSLAQRRPEPQLIPTPAPGTRIRTWVTNIHSKTFLAAPNA